MDEINHVRVDKDILDFLKVIYFGDISDPMEAASDRAYRDLNRTIRYNDMSSEQRTRLRETVTNLFREEIPALVKAAPSSQSEYDSWHYRICSRIRTCYREAGIALSYGQAQKWLNMAMKYLYVCGTYTFEGFFSYLHVPIDHYIFLIAKKELGIPCPKIRWSRWDDYTGQYMAYQLALRSRIQNMAPLRWEFRYWMQEARNWGQPARAPLGTQSRKVQILQTLLEKPNPSVSDYYEAMEKTQTLISNYTDYMETGPINCDRELLRLPEADFALTCALMTMLLREDHFCNGSFKRRLRVGQVKPILQQMIHQMTDEE